MDSSSQKQRPDSHVCFVVLQWYGCREAAVSVRRVCEVQRGQCEHAITARQRSNIRKYSMGRFMTSGSELWAALDLRWVPSSADRPEPRCTGLDKQTLWVKASLNKCCVDSKTGPNPQFLETTLNGDDLNRSEVQVSGVDT